MILHIFINNVTKLQLEFVDFSTKRDVYKLMTWIKYHYLMTLIKCHYLITVFNNS